MAVLKSRGSTGGTMLLKHAPAGTPKFDAESPGVGYLGDCTTCRNTGPTPELPRSGVGDREVAAQYRGFHDTSSE
jgi:hypothetical protein